MLAQGPKPSHPADPGRLHGQKQCVLQRAVGVEIQTVALTGRSWAPSGLPKDKAAWRAAKKNLSAPERPENSEAVHAFKIRLAEGSQLFVSPSNFFPGT